jgi:hypothetical protein
MRAAFISERDGASVAAASSGRTDAAAYKFVDRPLVRCLDGKSRPPHAEMCVMDDMIGGDGKLKLRGSNVGRPFYIGVTKLCCPDCANCVEQYNTKYPPGIERIVDTDKTEEYRGIDVGARVSARGGRAAGGALSARGMEEADRVTTSGSAMSRRPSSFIELGASGEEIDRDPSKRGAVLARGGHGTPYSKAWADPLFFARLGFARVTFASGRGIAQTAPPSPSDDEMGYAPRHLRADVVAVERGGIPASRSIAGILNLYDGGMAMLPASREAAMPPADDPLTVVGGGRKRRREGLMSGEADPRNLEGAGLEEGQVPPPVLRAGSAVDMAERMEREFNAAAGAFRLGYLASSSGRRGDAAGRNRGGYGRGGRRGRRGGR